MQSYRQIKFRRHDNQTGRARRLPRSNLDVDGFRPGFALSVFPYDQRLGSEGRGPFLVTGGSFARHTGRARETLSNVEGLIVMLWEMLACRGSDW